MIRRVLAGTTAVTPLVLRRSRLEERLDDAFGKRLTLVIAGAGYGKSTLVSGWTEDVVSTWHTATAGDRRLSSFAAGIAEALRPFVTDSAELVGPLTAADDELVQAETLASLLSDALEPALDHDLVLILDDAQELVSSPASLRLVESLCRQGPPGLRLVLLSRETLDLRVDRLRAQGQVLELDASDLAFTTGEVEALSLTVLDEGGAIAEAIHVETGGWPAAVRLALEVLAAIPADERKSALGRLRRTDGPLFSYLANEVFEREPPAVRELIRTVCPFESFTAELCHALGLAEPEETIGRLVTRGLFVREQEGEFRLHALIRGFARSAWPLTDTEENALRRRAASWLESRGRIEEALVLLAAGSHDQEIARLLESRGAELLGSGGIDTLISLASGLPSDLRVAEIEQLLGEALVMHQDMDGAIEAFERAAVKSGGVDVGLAWRLGMAHHFNGSLTLALESYGRADPEGGDTPDDALLLAWSASTHGIHYRVAEARTLADAALDLARRCGDDRALAAAHIAVSLVAGREGRAADGDAHNAAGLAAAERCGDLVLLSRVRTNIAAGLTERGAYREALVVLEETLRLADIPGFVVGNRTLTNRGNTHLHLGLLDEAAADFGALVEDARRTGDREGAWGIVGLGEVHRERGNDSLARAAYEEAIPLIQQIGGDGLAVGLSGMARVLVDDDSSAALRYAEWAVREPAPSPAPALNAFGWTALALGQRARAVEAAAEAGRRARMLGDRYGLAEALELEVFSSEEPASGVGRLEDALAIWRDLESRVRIAECELAIAALSTGAEARAARERAERKLRALGVRVSPSAPAGLLRTVASASPVPIAVQVLGGFSLLRDGAPVPRSAWQTRKPRELLKILICRRGRATPREAVMECLWPGDDPAKLGNRLSVALSTLRSVLDPEKRFAAEHFVRADRESMSVESGLGTGRRRGLPPRGRERPRASCVRGGGRSDRVACAG